MSDVHERLIDRPELNRGMDVRLLAGDRFRARGADRPIFGGRKVCLSKQCVRTCVDVIVASGAIHAHLDWKQKP